MALSPSATRLAIVLFVASGSTTYGYSSSIIATTLGQPTFLAYYGLDTSTDADSYIGAINGLFQAGGFVGTLISSSVADHYGRRVAILTSSIVCVIGGALQAGSIHIIMYIAMRFVTGVGVGT
jgi:MFS family permease